MNWLGNWFCCVFSSVALTHLLWLICSTQWLKGYSYVDDANDRESFVDNLPQ